MARTAPTMMCRLNAGNLAGVPGFAPGVGTQQFARYCDVRSHNFEVQVDVDMNGYSRHFFALISRGGKKPNYFQVFKFSSK